MLPKKWRDHFMRKQDEFENRIDCKPEGIRFDYIAKKVWVDHSLADNTNGPPLTIPPPVWVNGAEVFSILKRIGMAGTGEGKEFIDALKGKHGWRMEQEDKIKLLKGFLAACPAIGTQYDTIVKISTWSRLNSEFLHLLTSLLEIQHQIDNVFIEIPAGSVWMDHYYPESLTSGEQALIDEAFDRMVEENNDVFSYRFIPEALRYTVRESEDPDGTLNLPKYGRFVNGKRVLVLDDTIRSCTVVSSFCRHFLHMFTPASVQVVTLFSAGEG